MLGKLTGSSAFRDGSRKEPSLKPKPIDPSKAIMLPDGVAPELAEAMLDERLIRQVNESLEVSE